MSRRLAGVLIERQDGTRYVVLDIDGRVEVLRIEPPAAADRVYARPHEPFHLPARAVGFDS